VHTIPRRYVSCAVHQVIRSDSLDIQEHLMEEDPVERTLLWRTLMCGSWNLRPLGRARKRVRPTPVLTEIRTVHFTVEVRPVTTSRNSRDDPSFWDHGL
jgi:hypothetical protein